MGYTNLKGFRVMLGMTQKEFSDNLGMSLSAYCKRESGNIKFNSDEMEKIQKLFLTNGKNLSIEEIFFNNKVSKKD